MGVMNLVIIQKKEVGFKKQKIKRGPDVSSREREVSTVQSDHSCAGVGKGCRTLNTSQGDLFQ